MTRLDLLSSGKGLTWNHIDLAQNSAFMCPTLLQMPGQINVTARFNMYNETFDLVLQRYMTSQMATLH